MQKLSEHPCIMSFVIQVESLSRHPVIYMNTVAVLAQGYIHWISFVLVLVCSPENPKATCIAIVCVSVRVFHRALKSTFCLQ